MDYTQIVKAIIVLLFAIIDAYLIPLIKVKIKADRRAELIEYVTIAVEAADQIFGRQRGEEKKAYVLQYLELKGIKFDPETIDMVIESAVLQMKNSLLSE